MNFAYIRYSTSAQDETQQMQAIQEFCSQRGITIDAFEKDEGVSGGVSYRDRNLLNLVRKMKEGDSLVVSEISRLGRSMSDLNRLISEELKPRRVRLIVIKMGIDMDCSNLKAVDEMIFFALSFAAQVEKEMIQQRTKSALDARKVAIKENGGFFSKRGNYRTHLGNPKGVDMAPANFASGAANRKRANEWRSDSALYIWVERQVLRNRSRKEILEEAQELYKTNPQKFCTREGKMLTKGTLSRWVHEMSI